jgi:hypothetical protein
VVLVLLVVVVVAAAANFATSKNRSLTVLTSQQP